MSFKVEKLNGRRHDYRRADHFLFNFSMIKMRTHYEPFVLLAPGVVVLFVAFFVPIGYLCSYSFLVEQIDGTTKLGFGQYLRFFTDSYFWSVSERTLRLSLIITILCLILGFPLAYLMSRVSPRIRLWLTVLVILPLMTSVVIRTFGWLVLLGRGGPLTKVLSWRWSPKTGQCDKL